MSIENPLDNIPQKSPEEILREQIVAIESIPTGVQPRAEVVLVLLGEKPVTEMYLPDRGNVTKVIEDLRSVGLYAEEIEDQIRGSGDNAVDIGVAKSQELLDELKQTKSNKHHRRYGELMGYPSTAIDAFLGENGVDRLSDEEHEKLVENLPHVLTHFAFSKQNTEEELAKLKRWFKLIAQNAPELIDQLYSKEKADEFKEELLK